MGMIVARVVMGGRLGGADDDEAAVGGLSASTGTP